MWASDAANNSRELAAERLGEVDGDVVILINEPRGQGDVLDRMESNPLWSTLPAGGNDRVLVLDPAVSVAVGIGTALSIPFALDALEQQLPSLA